MPEGKLVLEEDRVIQWRKSPSLFYQFDKLLVTCKRVLINSLISSVLMNQIFQSDEGIIGPTCVNCTEHRQLQINSSAKCFV